MCASAKRCASAKEEKMTDFAKVVQPGFEGTSSSDIVTDPLSKRQVAHKVVRREYRINTGAEIFLECKCDCFEGSLQTALGPVPALQSCCSVHLLLRLNGHCHLGTVWGC